MKIFKIIGILLLVYVGIVVAFESLLGYFQPAGEGTIVITTTDSEGQQNDRVVSRITSNNQLYVAANHWPRAWYYAVLDNPAVQLTMDGTSADYEAVPVTGQEYERVNADHPLGPVFKVLTGFPPRELVRLDPR